MDTKTLRQVHEKAIEVLDEIEAIQASKAVYENTIEMWEALLPDVAQRARDRIKEIDQNIQLLQAYHAKIVSPFRKK